MPLLRRHVPDCRVGRDMPRRGRSHVVTLSWSVCRVDSGLDLPRHIAPMRVTHEQFWLDGARAPSSVARVLALAGRDSSAEAATGARRRIGIVPAFTSLVGHSVLTLGRMYDIHSESYPIVRRTHPNLRRHRHSLLSPCTLPRANRALPPEALARQVRAPACGRRFRAPLDVTAARAVDDVAFGHGNFSIFGASGLRNQIQAESSPISSGW
jgi:hypothetical protein